MELQSQDRLFIEKKDAIAKAIHEKFRRNQQERKSPDDPAMVPWEALSETLKGSNRHQADQIQEKLRRIGCAVRLPASGRPASFKFEPAEKEILAKMEHDRWVAERLQEGWRTGARDPERKMTPHLVSWDELEEDIREYDRDAVRAIPIILAEVGLEIYRRHAE